MDYVSTPERWWYNVSMFPIHSTLPRAIFVAVPLCTVLYVMVNLSYFTVMSAGDVLTSPAVAVVGI